MRFTHLPSTGGSRVGARIHTASRAVLPLLVPTNLFHTEDVRSGTFNPQAIFSPYIGPKQVIQIAEVSDDFRQAFLEGAVSTHVPKGSVVSLKYFKLDRFSTDIPIIAFFGGEHAVATSLVDLYTLLYRQRDAGFGPLLVTGGSNVMYIPDRTGSLKAVNVSWSTKSMDGS